MQGTYVRVGGTIGPGVALGACAPCAAGTYGAATGQSVCAPCGAGAYASTAGATACAACSAGTTSAPTQGKRCVLSVRAPASSLLGHLFAADALSSSARCACI